MHYVFGDFVLDDDTRQLQRAGAEVPLGGKAFELLELLLRSRPKALSRAKLHAALWPRTNVGGTSLYVLVSQVRAALGDDLQDPHWVRTVTRFGYAFRGDAKTEGASSGRLPEAPSRAWLTLGEQEWPLPEGESILGRDEGVAVKIESGGVSRHHARVLVRGGRATIEDLQSKNGTFLAGDPVSSPRSLKDGDVIRLGRQVRVVFRQSEKDATESEVSEGQ